MPELPEVEVTRRTVDEAMAGARVVALHMGKPLRWPLGCDPVVVGGQVVGSVQRRGKYLWMPLQADAPGRVSGGLLWHLGMSGSLGWWPDQSAPPRGAHDHVDLLTDRGVLRLHDPRRFGALVWGEGLGVGQVARLLAGLGVEPLTDDWTARHLHQALQGRRVAIKQALLAGDVVVGVGNIYASEALFRAGIDPRLAAGQLSRPRCARLVQAVREVLAEAVAAGGTTLRDFRNALGQQGHFQQATRVYDRAGLPCVVCDRPVRRIVQGQRATYYCATCQRR